LTSTPEPVRLHVSVEQSGRNCPYCRFALKAGIAGVECGGCHAIHHAECWDENRGCAMVGCAFGPSAQPAAPPVGVAPPSAASPAPSPAAAPPPVQQQWAPAAHPPIATPSAAEFTGRIMTWARTPVAVAVGTAALIAVGIMLAVGLALAVLTPERSLLGGFGDGIFKETMRDTVAMTMARFGFGEFKGVLLPVTFALVPIIAVAIGVRRSFGRLEGLPGTQRLLLAMATGIPLAILLLVLSLFAGGDGSGFSAVSIVFYSLLWGALGGALATRRAAGSAPMGELLGRVPASVQRWLGLGWTALRPLGLLLALCGIVGVLCWEAQIIRDQDNARLGRATATAIAETPLFAGQYAVTLSGLGAFAQFQPGAGEGGGFSTAIPPNDDGRVTGLFEKYRITGYHRAIPFALYVFLLILLPGAAFLLACYAGYATGQAAGARTAGSGAAHGTVTGAVWALALVALRAISGDRTVVGDSLFVTVLLLGAAAGALGGALAASRSRPAAGAPA